MSKRIYFASVKKWFEENKASIIATSIAAGTSIGVVLFYLSSMGAITITGMSEEVICEGSFRDPCFVYINFTANEDVFLYPLDYDPWGRNSLFEFDGEVESWEFQRSWGSGWRTIPLDRSCSGTWCGAPSNAANVGYSVVFREGREYQTRIKVIKKDPTQNFLINMFEEKIEIKSIKEFYLKEGVRIKNIDLEKAILELKGNTENRFLTLEYQLNKTNLQTSLKENIYSVSSDTKKINIYEKPEGTEYELILFEKPNTNIFEYDLISEGLSFYYQQPLYIEKGLKQETKDCNATHCEGKYRPENIVNSYAIYDDDKKIFHIYRPWVEDSTKNRIWADIKINQKENKLIIIVDENWLNEAKYPVIIDPTFGKTTIGASWTSVINFNRRVVAYGLEFPDLNNRFLIRAHTYTQEQFGGSWTAKLFLAEEDTERVVAVSDAFEAGGSSSWRNVSMFISEKLIANKTYYLGIRTSTTATTGSNRIAFDTRTENTTFRFNVDYPDMYNKTLSDKDYQSSEFYSIYFEYEEDTTAPTWSDEGQTEEIPGAEVTHYVLWEEDIGMLDTAIFEFDNCTGVLENISSFKLFNKDSWSNFTVKINETINCTVRWRVYANNTAGLFNQTDLFSYNALPTPTLNLTQISPFENITKNNATYFNWTTQMCCYSDFGFDCGLSNLTLFVEDINEEIIVFNTTGAHQWEVPEHVKSVDVLVVAGGGGGGGGGYNLPGGGGGAGGVIHNTSYSVSFGETIDVFVGAGGAGGQGGTTAPTFINGVPGQNSSFGTLVAVGGGYGGHSRLGPGGNGGSGGGGTSNVIISGAISGGSGTSGQGNAGGDGASANNNAAGGGGGASAVGGAGGASAAGDGGAGYNASSSFGTTYGENGVFGGGGGGGSRSSLTPGSGGIGGGGDGGYEAAGSNAMPNTGGGGGGPAFTATGGSGGSGIVLIKIKEYKNPFETSDQNPKEVNLSANTCENVTWNTFINASSLEEYFLYSFTNQIETNETIYSKEIIINVTESENQPSINLSFGPDVNVFRFETCGPGFENTSAVPEGQNSSHGIDKICNDGTGTGNVQIRLSDSLNTGWTWYASNTSITNNLIQLNTSWQTIYNALTESSCIYIWHRASCNKVTQGPGAYEEYQIVS